MTHTSVQWHGYFAAAPTPFTRSGKLDLVALSAVMAFLVENRAHGILVNGSTGEWFAQSPDERRTVAEHARASIPADRCFLVGVSSVDQDETILLARHAQELGADAVLLTAPPARRLSQQEVVEYFQEMCRRIDGPVMVYNIPPDVVTDIQPATIARLAEIDNVVAVKDSTPDDRQFLRTVGLVRHDIRIFGNVLTEASMAMLIAGVGAHGHFGSAMPLGSRLADAFDAARDGRTVEALEIARQFSALRTALAAFLDEDRPWGMHAEVKATMELIGVPAGRPRWPQLAIQDDARAMADLRALLVQHGAL